jgi:hypothetical protein
MTIKARRDVAAGHSPIAPLTIEERLRSFLFALAGAMCLGTIVELFLANHTKQPIQWLPFALCAAGLASVVAVWLRPNRASLWTLRIVMGLAAFGSLIGGYEHITSNLEVVRETKPTLTLLPALWLAAHGAAPLLAPGILAVAACVAIAATYYHPALAAQRLANLREPDAMAFDPRAN